MASLLSYSFFYTLITSTLLSSPTCHSIKDSDESFLVELVDHKTIKQKLSHFHLYWHDIFSGRAPTSIRIVNSPSNVSNGFGNINIIDNPLTLGPDMSSKTIGRAQGFYALASQQELGFLMTMNFVFTYGKYNGSTINILGRNAVLSPVREMPVIGGSGLFRFASGYAQARTHKLDKKSGDTTVKYDVYVMHY